MTETGDWLRQAHHHVDAAQTVLGGVGRGLTVAETVDAAAGRVFPVLRKLLAVVVVGAVVYGAYRVLAGHRTVETVQPDSAPAEDLDETPDGERSAPRPSATRS
jgi:hypothetical protein